MFTFLNLFLLKLKSQFEVDYVEVIKNKFYKFKKE